MLSRRSLIGKAAVGAAAVAAMGAAGTGVASARVPRAATGGAPGDPTHDRDGQSAEAAPEAIASPPPWELLSPLAAGAVIAHGWRLADLSPVQDGSCVVTLENERGRSHRIHLCRNDGTPQGLVYTRGLDLVVMNGGKGDLPTEEGLAQAVAALAHVVSTNEATLSLGDLQPHTERLRRFASADGTLEDGKLR